MMFGAVNGQRTTRKAAVSTSPVELETATAKKIVTLESITFCNTSGAARTVSLYVDSGGTQYPILSGLSLIAGATVLLENHSVVLAADEVLKVVASAAGITAVAVLILSMPNVASENAPLTLSTQAKK